MRETIWKPVFTFFCAVAAGIMVLSVILGWTALPACAEESVLTDVKYIDSSGDSLETMTCPAAIDLSTVSGDTIGDGSWYAVKGNVTRSNRLTIRGECHLILCADCMLTCEKGISCNRGNSLTIYCENSTRNGGLTCGEPEDNHAAIGGDEGKSAGTITIHGGVINANGLYGGAGIGGGSDGDSGTITIYGGTIKAIGGLNAAAIGGGNDGQVTDIRIYGGRVTAEGRGNLWTHNFELQGYASAIGSGSDKPQGGPIAIYGGTVQAKSVNGAGIGSGQSKAAGGITISGGTVTAVSESGAGIGGGRYGNGGRVFITGGYVTALSTQKGAGIGGGEKGSGGYVYIGGGKVLATGGNIDIGLFDSYNYTNYGLSWGADNPGWNIIASFIIALFKSGEFGGAGIGGGTYGSGGDVVIEGGEVFAHARNSASHAIGGGENKGGGTITIADGLCVMAGKDMNDPALALGDERVSLAGKSLFAHIRPCAHPDGYEYTFIDEKSHRFSCKYCTPGDGSTERHDFDENGDCVCGYGIYEVVLQANNSLAETLPPITVSKNDKYVVPACTYTPPEGKTFSYWQVVYLSHEYDVFTAEEGDELNPPSSKRIILIAQWTGSYNVWVNGIRVSDMNLDDVLGDGGTVAYKPGEDGQGTLVLDHPENLTGSYEDAIIYAENVDLTIEGSAVIRTDELPYRGISVKGGSLTLLTDDLEAYGSRVGILVESGSLQIAEGTCRVLAEGYGGIVARDGIEIGDGLEIVQPEDGRVEKQLQDDREIYTVIRESYPLFPAGTVEVKAVSVSVTWQPGYEGPDPVTEPITYGRTITMPSPSDEKIEFPAPEGKAFAGWSLTDGDAEAVVLKPGDSYTVKHDVTFTALWAETFPLWVGGIQVSAANAEDVLGDGGSVRYDPAESVLTLDNPEGGSSSGTEGLHERAFIYADGIDLTIKGRASINVSGISGSKGIVVSQKGSLTLLADSLTVRSARDGICVTEGDLNILGGTVTVRTSDSYGINVENGSLLIRDDPGGTMTVERVEAETASDTIAVIARYGAIEIGDTLEIITPEGGVIGGNGINRYIVAYTDEGAKAGHAVITRKSQESDPPGPTEAPGPTDIPDPTDAPEVKYTVTFVDEDGVTVLLAPLLYASGTPADKIIVPPDPYKKADSLYIYTFAGWTPELAEVTEDVTYRAVYTAAERSPEDAEYIVTFDSQGGTEVESQTVREGDTVTKPGDPVREGYRFVVWTLQGEAYDFDSPVTENLTLTADWEVMEPDIGGDYTVTDEIEAHDYEIYQIFTGDYAEMKDGEESYSVLSNVVWGVNGNYPEGISEGDPVSEDILQALYAVTDAAADRTKLMEIEKYVAFDTQPVRTVSVSGEEPVTVSLPAGYYLIRDRNLSQSGQDDAYTTYITVIVKDYTIAPKSVKPSVDKQVSDDEEYYYETTEKDNTTNQNPGVNGFYESADHAINETFQFRLAATLPASSRYEDYDAYTLIFHDDMSAGVSFEEIADVKLKLPDEGDCRLDAYQVDGVSAGEAGKAWTLTVTLPKRPGGEDETYSYLSDGAIVEVIYNAHLNENAVVFMESESDVQANSNRVYLEYSNNPNTDINPEADYADNMGRTKPDTVWVFTYGLDCVKRADREDGSPLAGAGFTLYSGTSEVLLRDLGDGSYCVADQSAAQGTVTEMVTGADGVFHVIGLDAGTYTLKETTTPAGYSTCEDTEVAIEASHAENSLMVSADLTLGESRLTYTIVDQSGTALPSTGGSGTGKLRLLGLLLSFFAGGLLLKLWAGRGRKPA